MSSASGGSAILIFSVVWKSRERDDKIVLAGIMCITSGVPEFSGLIFDYLFKTMLGSHNMKYVP